MVSRIRAPTVWSSQINKDIPNVNPFARDKTGNANNMGLMIDLVYLKNWDNFRKVLLESIVTNKKGEICFPISSYFLIFKPYLANAFKYHGGFIEVIKRLQREKLLPPYFQPVTDETAEVNAHYSNALALDDWGVMCDFMNEMSRRLGHFPKTPDELKQLGFSKANHLIKSEYGDLAAVERRMRAQEKKPGS